MVHPGGFEPPTARFVAEYSIQLSYGCIGKLALLRVSVTTNTCHTEYDGLIGRVTRLCLALRAAAFTALSLLIQKEDGASGRIRTSDRSVRSRVLYPAELRMQNGGEAGFEPRMQLLTAYSLSRGAPSASRPPHHTRLFRVLRRTCFCSSSLRWRTYYFLVLISQTLFRDLFRLHTSHAIRVQKRQKGQFINRKSALTLA